MSYELSLPEISVRQAGKLIKEKYEKILLITGGRKPEISWLRSAAEGRIIYCADSGLDVCLQANIQPDYIIGDGDSANKTNWQKAKTLKAIFEEFPADKDFTDTQLALKTITDRHNNADILVTGIWGGRFDHLYSSIFSLTSIIDNCTSICAADEKEALFYLKNASANIICKKKPVCISILPFSDICESVSIDKVKWPLDKVVLRQNYPYAVSNVLKDDTDFDVEIGKGLAGIYLYWNY